MLITCVEYCAEHFQKPEEKKNIPMDLLPLMVFCVRHVSNWVPFESISEVSVIEFHHAYCVARNIGRGTDTHASDGIFTALMKADCNSTTDRSAETLN